MGPALFWGLFLILIGLALIIKFAFNLDIPVIRIAVALLLILIGIRLLLRDRSIFRFSYDRSDVIFRKSEFAGSDLTGDEYNVIFGHGIFDLTDLDSTSLSKTIQINTIFGASLVKVNQDLPLLITGDAVFAGAKLLEGNERVFGELSYKSPSYSPDKQHLHLKTDVVFGALEVRHY